METLTLKQLRNRFVSDMNLPIQVVQSPYFEDRLELLEKEFGAKTKYDNLIKIIDERFDGKEIKFLEHYSEVRNKIITEMLSTKSWEHFMANKLPIIKQQNKGVIIGHRNLYTQEQDGGMFISLDMKKANFQALRYICKSLVLNAETYEELIGMFTDLDYIKDSKYTRQVIFGQMNPKKTMMIEKDITNDFANHLINKEHYLSNSINFDQFDVFSVNSDEIIFKFKGNEEEFEKIGESFFIKDVNFKSIIYRCNKFKLHHRQFKLATSDSLLNVFEKEDYLDGHRRHLHCVPATYYPQVYKSLGGMEITPSDLVFYYEHELCQFMNPLTLVK